MTEEHDNGKIEIMHKSIHQYVEPHHIIVDASMPAMRRVNEASTSLGKV